MSDPKDLLRIENLFIKLKNQGKSIPEIIDLLKIDADTINAWDISYNEAVKNIPNDPNLIVTIGSRGEDGRYIFSQKLQFQMSFLEKVKFDLWQASSMPDETINSSPNPSRYRQLREEAKKSHDTINKYFIEVDIREGENGGLQTEYKLNAESEEIYKEAKEAITFYIQTIYFSQKRMQDEIIIKSSSENIFTNSSKILPICIKQICIQDFHHIKDISLNYVPVDHNWIFITGENGFGKTLILRAIAIGLIGDRDNDTILTNELKAKISLEYLNFEENVINNFQPGNNLNALKEICCYGPSRLNISSNETKNDIDRKNSTTYGLFNNDGILLSIENELILSFYANKEEFESYKDLFKKLIPTLSFIYIEEKERRVCYIERDLENNESYKQSVTFEYLASGIKSLIAMVGDMIIRLKKSQPQITNFSDLCGIVIIDELDLHWHPKWQREIPRILTEIFPRIQFICTTHSEIPLLGAPINSTFLKVERNIKEGITLRKVEIEIENLLPNTVLTSPMFNMDHITSIANSDINNVRIEDKHSEIIENDKMNGLLKEFEEGNKQFPDNLFKES